MRAFLAVCLFAAAAMAADVCPPTFSYCDFWTTGECAAAGTHQSPIANNAADRKPDANLRAITFRYPNSVVTVKNMKYTLKSTTAQEISIQYEGVNYYLEEFHFHTPAEHVLDVWRGVPAELHLVHKTSDKSRAVVIAVAIRPGTSNAALEALERVGRPNECLTKTTPSAVEMSKLLPLVRGRYITYVGSLTTPPCSGGVRFVLMNDGITATQAEIDHLRLAMNARPAQYNPNPVTYRVAMPGD
jgi:carbonic anhydrase